MWLLHLLLLFAVYSVGPGLFFVRRLKLSPSEKLVTAVGLSYFIVYLGSFGILVVAGHRMTDRPDLQRALHTGLAVVCLLLTLASLRDLVRLLNHAPARRMVAAYGLFLLWGFLLLSMIRSYGGGTWSADWLEHYQRARFYLGDLPRDYQFLDKFSLPARPPLMNAVTASFLAQVGATYDVYQLAMLALNSLVFLPCCLIAGKLAPRPPRTTTWLLLLLFAASPMVVQNLTYAWTKLFTAFYVILGLHLYLRGWRKGSRLGVVLAFASLCAAMLVHYSAGPYAVFVGLHYLLAVFPRRRGRWAEAAVTAGVCLAVLGTWFAWSTAVYGTRGTVASTSTVTDVAPTAGGNLVTFAKNLGNTLFPSVLRRPATMADPDLKQDDALGKVRDVVFLAYQQSLPFALGSGGAAVVIYLLWRLLRPRGQVRSDERRFWLAFVPFITLVGVAVHTAYDRFGLVHICLQAMVLLGLTLAAAGWPRVPPALRWVLAAGVVLDFALGVFLHFTFQHRDHPLVEVAPNIWVFPDTMTDLWSHAAQANLMIKRTFFLPFWGDLFQDTLAVLQVALLLMFLLFLWLGLVRPLLARKGGLHRTCKTPHPASRARPAKRASR
jgi:hypothetical protein